MVAINLMPWRPHRQAYEKKIEKIILIGSVVFSIVLILSVHYILSCQSSEVQEDISKLQVEKSQYKEIKQTVINHADVSKVDIYADRLDVVLPVLETDANAGLCFTSVARRKNKIMFSGNVRSPMELSTFIQHWKSAALFSEIKIERLQQQPSNQLMSFSLEAIAA